MTAPLPERVPCGVCEYERTRCLACIYSETIAALRAENARLTSEVERLRVAMLFCSGSCNYSYRAALDAGDTGRGT